MRSEAKVSAETTREAEANSAHLTNGVTDIPSPRAVDHTAKAVARSCTKKMSERVAGTSVSRGAILGVERSKSKRRLSSSHFDGLKRASPEATDHPSSKDASVALSCSAPDRGSEEEQSGDKVPATPQKVLAAGQWAPTVDISHGTATVDSTSSGRKKGANSDG